MFKILLTTLATVTMTIVLASSSEAKKSQASSSCVQECEAKSAEFGGQLVQKRAKKEITKEEYDKEARHSNNEDFKCIKACKMNKSGKSEKDGKK